MRSPEQDEGRPSTTLPLAVESLEGRRLPSGMVIPSAGPAAWSGGTIVYKLDGAGGFAGSAIAVKGERPLAPPPKVWALMRPGPPDGFRGHGDTFHAFGPPDRLMFSKAAWLGDVGHKLEPRAGGGDGPVEVRYSTFSAAAVPGVRIEGMIVSNGPPRLRAAVNDGPSMVVFGRTARVPAPPPLPDAQALTEATETPAALPIAVAATPEPVVAASPAKAAPPAVVAPASQGVPIAAVQGQDRRTIAIADRADPAATAFRPSATGAATAAVVTAAPGGESVAGRTREAAPTITRVAARPVVDEREGAAPEGAELLTHFLPLDRATLELAIDRVFGQIGTLGPELPELSGPIDWATASMALLATGLAADLAVRALKRSRRVEGEEGEPDGEEAGYVTFPGLPGGWKLEER